MDGLSALMEMGVKVTTWVIPVLFAVTLHEVAHGYAAALLGDSTAKEQKRLSLNPLRHLDPVGSVLLPGLLLLAGAPFLFGWAKPVPVNFRRLHNPKQDMVLVALAGPGTNLVLAIVSALALGALASVTDLQSMAWVVRNLFNFMLINLVLAVFNMIPIPPLDGGRVAVGILPPSLAAPLAQLERSGFFIVIGIMLILPMIGDRLGLNLDPIGWIIERAVSTLSTALLGMVGF